MVVHLEASTIAATIDLDWAGRLTEDSFLSMERFILTVRTGREWYDLGREIAVEAG